MGCDAGTCGMSLDDSPHSLGITQLGLLCECAADWEIQTADHFLFFLITLGSRMNPMMKVLASFKSLLPDLKMPSSSCLSSTQVLPLCVPLL